MFDKECCQKIIAKVEPLLKREVAVLDLRNNIIAKSDSFASLNKINKEKTIPITFQSEKLGSIYINEDPKKVKEMKDVLKTLIEMFLEQETLLEKIPLKDRYLDKFVYDLLYQKSDDEDLFEQSKIFNINLKIPRVAITILINGNERNILTGTNITGEEKENYIQRIRENIGRAINSFYTSHKENIVSYIGDNIFVILKDIGQHQHIKESVDHFNKTIETLHYVIKSEIRNPLTIGVGRYYEGISGLSQSFGEALLTARLGEDLWGNDGIYHFDNFGVLAPVLSGLDKKACGYPSDMFSKFSNKPEVIKTLNTFFDTNMSLTETAKKLKIHRNTLIYRLDKIAETLKLDPRVFDSAVQIKLAMLFNNFLAGEAL
ncbi:MAG: helix-turn-helix domain-containing protein [Patescibacteria group bacterium]|nr:helix-turn-helix domain-containing protein [Patescibacteria group bacterium]